MTATNQTKRTTRFTSTTSTNYQTKLFKTTTNSRTRNQTNLIKPITESTKETLSRLVKLNSTSKIPNSTKPASFLIKKYSDLNIPSTPKNKTTKPITTKQSQTQLDKELLNEAKSKKVSLKLLIDAKAHKVLFAEAGKDFVDFLFDLLSLPVGTVIGLLTSENMVGCIGNLYQSGRNLNQAYLQPNQNNDLLFKPKTPISVANVPLLLPSDCVSSAAIMFYNCGNSHRHVTNKAGTKCPSCNHRMSTEVPFVGPVNESAASSTAEGGYVKGLVTYMVTDDLSVMPMSMISGMSMLNKCNAMEFNALEEKVVEFGIDEGLKLLKGSLKSKAALTHVFLGKKGVKNEGGAK